jgi:hypothetical protein
MALVRIRSSGIFPGLGCLLKVPAKLEELGQTYKGFLPLPRGQWGGFYGFFKPSHFIHKKDLRGTLGIQSGMKASYYSQQQAPQ